MKGLYRLLIFAGAALLGPMMAHAEPIKSDKTAYDFSFKSLDGKPINLSDYKGKVLLVVNTASKCGFTKQYAGLEALYKKYKDRGLVIIGVPSNDFKNQEPGSEAEIKKFCQLNYGVTFPMTAKYNVIGAEAHPFYVWIHDVLGFWSAPKWNFHKYLIDREGHPVDFFGSTTKPESETLVNAIEKQL